MKFTFKCDVEETDDVVGVDMEISGTCMITDAALHAIIAALLSTLILQLEQKAVCGEDVRRRLVPARQAYEILSPSGKMRDFHAYRQEH